MALTKKRPPRRRRQQLELEDGFGQARAICDQEKPVEFGLLLKQADNLRGGSEDPLEELRRRIKRTRAKMDSQNQVMDGFICEVRQMNALHRNFSATELSPPSSPAGVPALTNSKAPAALCSGSSGAELALRRKGAPQRPTSASNTTQARMLSLRSDTGSGRRLGESRSQPALTAAAMGSLHQAAPLALPPRRAPPGAPCSEFDKAISGAAAARRGAVAAAAATGCGAGSGVARRMSHIGLGRAC